MKIGRDWHDKNLKAEGKGLGKDEERDKDAQDSQDMTTDKRELPPANNPWRDIFLRPRATARWLLANETAGSAQMLWLSFTALFIAMTFLALTFHPGAIDRQVSRIQLVVLTPLIFLLSWGYFIIESYLLWLFCKILGGRSEVRDMRVITAYTTVIPSVAFGFVRFGLFFLIGRTGLVAAFVDNIILIWTAYITLGGITAAAGLPAWRALVAYLISMGVWFVGGTVALGLVQAVVGRWPGLF